MGFDRNRFEGHIFGELICSICLNVLEDPAEAPVCEHVFCRKCITTWLHQHQICPIDRQPLQIRSLKQVSRYFRTLLGELDMRCEFYSSGCKTLVKLDLVTGHQAKCLFNPSLAKSCPMGCGAVLKRAKAEDEFPPHSCIVYLLSLIRGNTNEEEVARGLSKTIEAQKEEMTNMRRKLMDIEEQVAAKSLTTERLVIVTQDHKKIVEKLRDDGHWVCDTVTRTMTCVDFQHFFSKTPNDVAVMAKRLQDMVQYTEKSPKILEIFYKHKYISTCLALMVGPRGSVVALTHQKHDKDKVKKGHGYLLDEGRLTLIHEPDETKRRAGYPATGPYDLVILFDVEDAETVASQVRPGGKLFCPNSSLIWEKQADGELQDLS